MCMYVFLWKTWVIFGFFTAVRLQGPMGWSFGEFTGFWPRRTIQLPFWKRISKEEREKIRGQRGNYYLLLKRDCFFPRKKCLFVVSRVLEERCDDDIDIEITRRNLFSSTFKKCSVCLFSSKGSPLKNLSQTRMKSRSLPLLYSWGERGGVSWVTQVSLQRYDTDSNGGSAIWKWPKGERKEGFCFLKHTD